MRLRQSGRGLVDGVCIAILVASAVATPQAFMQRVVALEAEMDESGTFVFGGALQGSDEATVIRIEDAGVQTAHGPFAVSNAHIAGFYIINADDLDAALKWAKKVTDCIGNVIEVRPFGGTGKAADNMPG